MKSVSGNAANEHGPKRNKSFYYYFYHGCIRDRKRAEMLMAKSAAQNVAHITDDNEHFKHGMPFH